MGCRQIARSWFKGAHHIQNGCRFRLVLAPALQLQPFFAALDALAASNGVLAAGALALHRTILRQSNSRRRCSFYLGNSLLAHFAFASVASRGFLD
jgi:hypothetical protein